MFPPAAGVYPQNEHPLYGTQTFALATPRKQKSRGAAAPRGSPRWVHPDTGKLVDRHTVNDLKALPASDPRWVAPSRAALRSPPPGGGGRSVAQGSTKF